MLSRRSTAVVAALCCVLLFASCHGFFGARDDSGGGGGGTGVTPSFAYVATASSTSPAAVQAISSYTVNASTGALTGTASSTLTFELLDSLCVKANSAATHVFVAGGTQGLLDFQINRSSGTLTTAGQSGPVTLPPLSLPFAPSALVVNSAGTLVYAISNQNKALSAFQIGAATIPQTGSARYFDIAPLNLTLDPSGRFLYVADNGGGTYVFPVSTSGALSDPANVPANGGLAARAIALTPDGKFAYISNGANTGGVDMYAVNANSGALTLISGSPKTTGGSDPNALVVDPTGKYLFVANANSKNVSAFAIATDGTLTAATGSPFNAGTNPVDVAVDPSGNFVYVVNKDDQTVSIFKIESGGALVSKGYIPIPNPVSIAVTK